MLAYIINIQSNYANFIFLNLIYWLKFIDIYIELQKMLLVGESS